MEPLKSCPFCEGNIEIEGMEDMQSVITYHCDRCTDFIINTWPGLDRMIFDDRSHIISGYLRSRYDNKLEPLTLTNEVIQEILSTTSYPRTVSDKMNKIVSYIGDRAKTPGSRIQLDSSKDYTIMYAENGNEFVTIMMYLADNRLVQSSGSFYSLTFDGWNKYEEFQRNPPKTNQAFVAMWFGHPNRVEDMKSVYGGAIKKAIDEAETSPKYKPLRIDLLEDNDPIDQRILVEIRRSRFVVADLTGNRGGVYFEAGYAMSLGIPVIWMCEEGTQVHFDVGQFRRIIWKDENDLYEKLKRRIEGSNF